MWGWPMERHRHYLYVRLEGHGSSGLNSHHLDSQRFVAIKILKALSNAYPNIELVRHYLCVKTLSRISC